MHGPEDVDVDDQGRIYGGTHDGRILRLLPDGNVEVFAETGGRPLGMEFDGQGNLIVCDAWKGLLRIDPDGNIETLATETDGLPFAFTDDLDIATDGVIYFTDASSRFHQPDYLLDLLEARPWGRLLAHDPRDGSTRLLMDGLYFANGVALSSDESFVLVSETYRYRIQRYWLRGPRAGRSDIFIDNLPGFPDGVSSNRQGTFWVAMATPRKSLVDAMHPYPFLKNALARLPRSLWPKPVRYGLVLGLGEDGQVALSLHDPGGERVHMVTSVEQRGDHLYLGSLTNDRIARVPVPEGI